MRPNSNDPLLLPSACVCKAENAADAPSMRLSPPVYHFVTQDLLCSSVCVYNLRSEEAIKTLHSIGARWKESLYKQQDRATLPPTESTNTHRDLTY